jgi:hypothetical protein
MEPRRYFRITVYEGTSEKPAYFYETPQGQFDIRFRWADHSSGMHPTLQDAVDDFLEHAQSRHDIAKDGITITATQPVEVSKAEVDRAREEKTYW